MSQLPAPPFKTDLLGTVRSYLSDVWVRWLTSVWQGVNASPQQIGRVSLTTQTGTITGTAIPTPTLTTGRYRAAWYTRITQPASTGSSLQVTVQWTDGGVTQTASGAALTGNTTTTYESKDVPLFTADAKSTVTYATAYSSTGATGMKYAFTVTLESVP